MNTYATAERRGVDRLVGIGDAADRLGVSRRLETSFCR
jgi:hypothetical protein